PPPPPLTNGTYTRDPPEDEGCVFVRTPHRLHDAPAPPPPPHPKKKKKKKKKKNKHHKTTKKKKKKKKKNK
ncbi:hypothetical protein AB1328_39695, partial [Streptomyces virginiae]